MITVTKWCAGGTGGREDDWGDERSVQTFYNLFLKPLTEGAVTAETGSLFQHFTALTEKADPLLRRQLVPLGTL